jgi:hypothetical protein
MKLSERKNVRIENKWHVETCTYTDCKYLVGASKVKHVVHTFLRFLEGKHLEFSNFMSSIIFIQFKLTVGCQILENI